MRYKTVTERIGENMGPIDWSHIIASNKPDIWREAEANPTAFLFNDRQIIAIAMYDGWPYWKPTPAINFIGPIGPEWNFFNSYGVYDTSITKRPVHDLDAQIRILGADSLLPDWN